MCDLSIGKKRRIKFLVFFLILLFFHPLVSSSQYNSIEASEKDKLYFSSQLTPGSIIKWNITKFDLKGFDEIYTTQNDSKDVPFIHVGSIITLQIINSIKNIDSYSSGPILGPYYNNNFAGIFSLTIDSKSIMEYVNQDGLGLNIITLRSGVTDEGITWENRNSRFFPLYLFVDLHSTNGSVINRFDNEIKDLNKSGITIFDNEVTISSYKEFLLVDKSTGVINFYSQEIFGLESSLSIEFIKIEENLVVDILTYLDEFVLVTGVILGFSFIIAFVSYIRFTKSLSPQLRQISKPSFSKYLSDTIKTKTTKKPKPKIHIEPILEEIEDILKSNQDE